MPCNTQVQIAPTFDTGNEPAVTLTPYGTDDPCAPASSPTVVPAQLQAVPNSCTNQSQQLPFDYPNFNTYSALCFVEDAEPEGSPGVLKLTPATNYKWGGVWHNRKHNLIGNWDSHFTFRITRPLNQAQGANGIAFVIHNDPDNVAAIGSYASGLGYGNDYNPVGKYVRKGVAIMFHTYVPETRSGPLTLEEGTRVLQIRYRNNLVLAQSLNAHFVHHDGQPHDIRVSYRGTTLKVSALVNGVWQTLIQANVNLATELDGTSGYIGFTGATGSSGIVNKHEILKWRMSAVTRVCNVNAVDTIGAYYPTESRFLLRNSNSAGSAALDFNFGTPPLSPQPAFVPLAGDWDGDGIDTIGLYNPANGAFLLRDSNSAGPVDYAFTFSSAEPLNKVPLVGDWNGDGIDTIGVYNRDTSRFLLRDSNDNGNADYNVQYAAGMYQVTPLVGDWNGDGKDTIGVYGATVNNGTKNFYLNDGFDTTTEYSFGYGSDLPTARQYTGDWSASTTDCKQTVGQYRPYDQYAHNQADVASKVYLRANSSSSGPSQISTLSNSPINAVEPFTYNPVLSGSLIPLAGRWELVEGGQCTFTFKGNTAPIRRGPSQDDLYVADQDANLYQVQAFAIDELSRKWYGFYHTARPAYKSWIVASAVDEKETVGCASLPDESTQPDLAPWTSLPLITSPVLPSSLRPSQFRGFGIVDTAAYSSFAKCYHNGFDFNITSGTQGKTGVAIKSIADGIIVGMGTHFDFIRESRSPAVWGATDSDLPATDNKTNSGGLNLVIRTGGHFVLYGHLASIESSLYYGARVKAGDTIGELASQNQNTNTHLHVEIIAFRSLDKVNDALYPRFGAVDYLSSTKPSNFIDLMVYVANKGSVTSSVPVSVVGCNAGSPPNFSYTGNNSSGALIPVIPSTVTPIPINYQSNSSISQQCVDFTSGTPRPIPTCLSIPPSTFTPIFTPTFTPTP